MSALQCLSIDDLRARLAKALDAKHELLTGATSVSFSTGAGASRSISRQQRIADVDQYINELQAAIDAKTGKRTGGPLYFARAGW